MTTTTPPPSSPDPTTSPGPILVTGPNGKTGSRVAARLTALGHDVRPASRSATTPFDWDDQSTWRPALQGARAVYLTFQPDLGLPGATEAITAISALAAGAGVERAVLVSGRGVAEARACEAAFLSALPRGTVVRCAFFDQNFSEGVFADGVLSGVFALPASREVTEPFLHADDIADVAVAALTGPAADHEGRVHEITGPRSLRLDEVAEVLSAASGRAVEFAPVSRAEFTAGAVQAGVDEHEAAGLAELLAEFLDGRNAATTSGVQDVLGRPARSFEEFARGAAATGVWSAVPAR